MKILVDIDQAECIRQGIDAPSSTIKLDVNPAALTEEQRNFLADELYDGLRFPSDGEYDVCPPTYEGFIAAIKYGLEYEELKGDLAFLEKTADLDEMDKLRLKLVKAAIKESVEKGSLVLE